MNEELYSCFATQRVAWAKMDNEIIGAMAERTADDMSGDVAFKTTSGDPHAMVRSVIMQHFFNHQMHHRGQVHDMLCQTEVEALPLDLLYSILG